MSGRDYLTITSTLFLDMKVLLEAFIAFPVVSVTSHILTSE